MTKIFQRLTKGSWRDRLKVVVWSVVLLDVILAPIEFLLEVVVGLTIGLVGLFVSLFARTMETKGFDDRVYKKKVGLSLTCRYSCGSLQVSSTRIHRLDRDIDVQRLIERNRKLEEAGR
jgi:hypothetical protein